MEPTHIEVDLTDEPEKPDILHQAPPGFQYSVTQRHDLNTNVWCLREDDLFRMIDMMIDAYKKLPDQPNSAMESLRMSQNFLPSQLRERYLIQKPPF